MRVHAIGELPFSLPHVRRQIERQKMLDGFAEAHELLARLRDQTKALTAANREAYAILAEIPVLGPLLTAGIDPP